MKVRELKPGQKEAEMKKVIRVRALGERDIYVGYYNHLRRRGGDIFILRPVIRVREIPVLDAQGNKVTVDGPNGRKIVKKIKEQMLITAEMQFSERWMERVDSKIPETKPVHFNEIGRGKKRLDIPGMTSKVGLNDNVMPDENTEEEIISENENSGQDAATTQNEEVVI